MSCPAKEFGYSKSVCRVLVCREHVLHPAGWGCELLLWTVLCFGLA